MFQCELFSVGTWYGSGSIVRKECSFSGCNSVIGGMEGFDVDLVVEACCSKMDGKV